jgi:peroxiredoxin
LPLIQKAHEQLRNDPKVKFILVSVDDDPKRLQAYVDERKFAFPVLRTTREWAAQHFGIDDTPITFYIDANGVIQYQTRGGSVFGESTERVIWYLNELKQIPTAP